jgi:uncharacterized membrane protein YjgN (DUF898 family)
MSTSSFTGSAAVEPSFDSTASPRERTIELRFTGSGSEYFRIWIVNLLLTIVTVGLYFPWAKVRRLRYFYGNTVVDGHALDFHGKPLKMLRGYILVAVLSGLYVAATKVSSVATLVSFLILCAIWPALLRASMKFRLANTSWRGLRFQFKGDMAGAYKAMVPLFVPGLAFVILSMGLHPEKPQEIPSWFFPAYGVIMLSLVATGPWLLWNFKKYQHDHYAIGQVQTGFKARLVSFYGVFAKTFGVSLLAGVVMVVVMVVLTVIGFAGLALGKGGPNANQMAIIIATIVVMAVMLLLIQLLPRPYFESQMQNLVWSRTEAQRLQFKSRLGFGAMFGLTLKNWLLMVLTLGLYWPFARIALTRLRLQAVSIATSLDLDDLHQQLRVAENDAAGDAAGDFFGIDIGL